MEKSDFIIVGSGVAGLRAAIELSAAGEVRVLTKSRADESSSEYAQGGIAAAMSDEDEIGLHYEDTIRAGDGLCDEAAVRILVEEGPPRIQELIAWGTQFDREGMKLSFSREAAHSRKRILHAGGDSTGREIVRSLIHKVKTLENVRLLPHSFALDILRDGNTCVGVRYLDEKSGRVRELAAAAVLLATGGLGRLYRETTNPEVATGDGYALAFRAGAALADMEFIQFHPTALKLAGAPQFLLSEAVRGEGAVLRNLEGEAFMSRYHSLADLASRDVVARAIIAEARRTNSDAVFLDATGLKADFVKRRFPRIFQTCLRLGLDMTRERIPVFPAAHYTMGGVLVDLQGRTTLTGLMAAGEVACNGVHGANRLASNSLLEGLVYGARAGRVMRESPIAFSPAAHRVGSESWTQVKNRDLPAGLKEKIRQIMSEAVGVMRSGQGLTAALERLAEIPFSEDPAREAQEVGNLLINARIISTGALLRKESRGSHYRSDFAVRDDRNWRSRLLFRLDPIQNILLQEKLMLPSAAGSEDEEKKMRANPARLV